MLFRIAFLALILLPQIVFAQLEDTDCLECHGDPAKTKFVIDPKLIQRSVHGDQACIDCHDSITEKEHPKDLPNVNCSNCHDDAAEEMKESVHASAKVNNPELQPSCAACHGMHLILPKKNPDSKINSRNISRTCGHCHSNPEVIALTGRRGVDPAAFYHNSIHAKRLEEYWSSTDQARKAKKQPATCIDCHGSHGILSNLQPTSSINKFVLPETCGKCHSLERDEYLQSIHWQSIRQDGNYEAPVCNDCHGEHQILQKSNDALASTQTCASCHANNVLMSRFGLDGERFATYLRTYHGLAVLRGSPDAARCVSCHEIHAIRGQKDPLSPVHENNLVATCGKCHPNSSPSFVQVSVHPLNQRERNPIAYSFRVVYIWLIILVIGGMLVHNAVILFYYIQEKWRHESSQKQVRRFQPFEVVQHLVLFISFTLLAITGFALKFPNAFWAEWLSSLGMTEAIRALIHRISAVALMIASVIQMGYFILIRQGRREVRELVPTYRDFLDFIKNMRFYLRFSSDKPRFGRFDYTEKAEYLALIWGTAVMAATGFILWFPEVAMPFLPVWAFEVAEVIHVFEAILATLAIIVWHLFFTVYHPERYPMNLSWITGRVPLEEQLHHHPLEKQGEEKKPWDKDKS